jgi:hypothetical protein
VTEEQRQLARAAFATGCQAYERGSYRQAVADLEVAHGLVDPGTEFQGEVRTWLVMAYDAVGAADRALELCRRLARHGNPNIRKEGQRLLYILEAPQLKLQPEWLSEIPDLTEVEPSKDSWGGTKFASSASPPRVKPPEGYQIPPPTDPTQVKVDDPGLRWGAIIVVALALGTLWWFRNGN